MVVEVVTIEIVVEGEVTTNTGVATIMITEVDTEVAIEEIEVASKEGVAKTMKDGNKHNHNNGRIIIKD